MYSSYRCRVEIKRLEDKLNSMSMGNLDLNKFKDNRVQSDIPRIIVERVKEKPVDRAVANKVEKMAWNKLE